MEPIPNWFRWLIIVVATLIMCACRAPLQQSQTQSVLKQSVSKQAVVTSPANESVLSTLLKLRGQYDIDSEYVASANPPEPVANANSAECGPEHCPAPIVHQAGRSLRVQDVQNLSGPAPLHKAPIYFHVDDADWMIQKTQALQPIESATQGIAPSPFLDDPEMPVTDSLPLTPVVDPNFVEPAPISPPTYAPSPEVTIGPSYDPIVGEQSMPPLATEYIMPTAPLAAPYDFLPQAEIPMDCPPEQWACSPSETLAASFKDMSQRYPDEYVCDGGDALGQVSVAGDWSLNGLDPEDTIGHFDTLDRTVEVAASNRVCIYAPRFAAVRKVTSPFQSEQREQVLIEQRDDLAVTEHQQISTEDYSQAVMAQRHLVSQPASSLKRELPGITGVHTLPVRILDHDLSVHEDFRIMKLGIHKQAEKPRLTQYAAKAVSWSHDKAVQVVVDEVAAQTKIGLKGIESIHTIGDNRPAKLRVIKTASVSDALPGEEVEFTLRFDNIGHQPMGNVTIVDNLTTRLEYLDKTELCSLEANFVEDENEVDSLTLRWEIVEPIKPGKGGLIRFRCRVR